MHKIQKNLNIEKDIYFDSSSSKLSENPISSFQAEYILSGYNEKIEHKKLLNIGCWTPNLEFVLMKYTSDNLRLYSIDIYPEVIKNNRKILPYVHFIETSVLDMPFSNGFFDIVIMFDVIEHLPRGKEDRALSNINRILKKDGFLFLSTPDKNILSQLLDIPYRTLIKHRHYSYLELESYFKNYNFKILHYCRKGRIFYFLHYFLGSIAKYLLKKNLYDTFLGKYMRHKINKELQIEGYFENYFILTKIDNLSKYEIS